jgi:hypothetical protein
LFCDSGDQPYFAVNYAINLDGDRDGMGTY